MEKIFTTPKEKLIGLKISIPKTLQSRVWSALPRPFMAFEKSMPQYIKKGNKEACCIHYPWHNYDDLFILVENGVITAFKHITDGYPHRYTWEDFVKEKLNLSIEYDGEKFYTNEN